MAYGRGPYGAEPLGGIVRNGVSSGLTATATGSQAAVESGTPLLQVSVPAAGGQVAVESGTVLLQVSVPVAGSQVAVESGAATVALGGGAPLAVAATGSEVAAESGAGVAALEAASTLPLWAPGRYFPPVVPLRLTPRGAEVGTESGWPATVMVDLWADENEVAILAAMEVA